MRTDPRAVKQRADVCDSGAQADGVADVLPGRGFHT